MARSIFALASVAIAALTGIGVSGVAGQTRGAQTPPILAESLAGRDSFELYCAPCHGSGGRGDGPVAPALRTRPADLTTLARRNDGAFPGEDVRAFVTGTGRTLAAHGTTEMPIWGPMFRAFESDARARERIANLVSFIESMQVATSASNTPGSQLFRTYCASCHGSTARGNGPLADTLRRPPPDLTKFAARNGGMFPSERVFRIIDGREVRAHGNTEMPIWGDAFKSTRDGIAPETAKARIAAIVAYLEAIQERAAE